MSLPTYSFVLPADVRDYMTLNSTPSASRYNDAQIGSNIRAAGEFIEKATHRYFADRPGKTLQFTTMGRAQLFLPGVRMVTTVTFAGAALVSGTSCWLLPDVQQSGISTGIMLRAFRNPDFGPWWMNNSQWFDRGLDSPYYPANYGGGYVQTSMPLDLVIVGDWGYADADVPYEVRHVIKVLAAWYTERPNSVLAGVSMTPSGAVLDYSQLPPEVATFVSGWKIGEQVVSVG